MWKWLGSAVGQAAAAEKDKPATPVSRRHATAAESPSISRTSSVTSLRKFEPQRPVVELTPRISAFVYGRPLHPLKLTCCLYWQPQQPEYENRVGPECALQYVLVCMRCIPTCSVASMCMCKERTETVATLLQQECLVSDHQDTYTGRTNLQQFYP